MNYLVLTKFDYGGYDCEAEVTAVDILYDPSYFDSKALYTEYETWYWNWMTKVSKYPRAKKRLVFAKHHDFSWWLRTHKGFKKIRKEHVQFLRQ